MEIERLVTERRNVGFKCDLCHKNFKTDKYFEDEDWELSDHGKLILDCKNGDWQFTDLCQKCYVIVAQFIENHGGKINTLR